MKLLQQLNESVEVIVEGTAKNRSYFIEGIYMQSNVGNKNGRIYPREILFNEAKRYKKEVICDNRALGELGHPEGPQLNLERVSHRILDLWEDGDNIMGKAKIMSTPYGEIVKELIREGVKFGVSSRALGSLKQKGELQEVQSDFWLSTIDIVHDPSAPDAFVAGLMEGKEWIVENGIIKEKTIEKYKKDIRKATLNELETVKLGAFQDYLKTLCK